MIKRSIMLAHAGRIADAVALIEQSLRALPARCGRTRFILTRARDANPAAIDPLLARLPPASVSCLANGV